MKKPRFYYVFTYSLKAFKAQQSYVPHFVPDDLAVFLFISFLFFLIEISITLSTFKKGGYIYQCLICKLETKTQF